MFIDPDPIAPPYNDMFEDRPKRVHLIDFKDYPSAFLNRLVDKAFEKQSEFNSTKFKEQLVYIWPDVWKSHYDFIDSTGTREKINKDLSQSLKFHLVEAGFVYSKPGKAANSEVITLSNDGKNMVVET